METNLSRRGFLTGAAAAGALAAMGLAGCAPTPAAEGSTKTAETGAAAPSWRDKPEMPTEFVETVDADIVVVAFGASARVARSAVNAAREKGIRAGLFRPVTLWPFPVDGLRATLGTAKAYLDVEMNMGQMVDDVRLVVEGRAPVEFLGRAGGMIPTPEEVLARIEEINERIGE